jgi:hypothetical protein
MSAVHKQLIENYEATVRTANQKLEQDIRMPYGELHQIYSQHFEHSQRLFMEVWERDYAGGLVREALQLMLGELHRFEVIDDKRFLALSKELFVGRDAQAALNARHEHVSILEK